MANIYPHEARQNYHCRLYWEMAMESYYTATSLLEEIKNHKCWYEVIEQRNALFKNAISTVVFSAMAIESFFNDYAAACLGDSDFYDNFDQLSVLGKFELIARFILNATIDKSKAYYCHLKVLIRDRNTFVHNKSTRLVGYSSLEEIEETNRLLEEQTGLSYNPNIDFDEIKKEMNQALNSLKAVRDIARFFSKHDDSRHAEVGLLGAGMYFEEEEPAYRKYVFSALGI